MRFIDFTRKFIAFCGKSFFRLAIFKKNMANTTAAITPIVEKIIAIIAPAITATTPEPTDTGRDNIFFTTFFATLDFFFLSR